MPRHFISPSGYAVTMGRNAHENQNIAQAMGGNDLWFHIQGCPGAHVILRLQKHDPVDPKDVLFCKELAIQYSKCGVNQVVTMVRGVDVYMMDSHSKHSRPGCVRVRVRVRA